MQLPINIHPMSKARVKVRVLEQYICTECPIIPQFQNIYRNFLIIITGIVGHSNIHSNQSYGLLLNTICSISPVSNMFYL